MTNKERMERVKAAIYALGMGYQKELSQKGKERQREYNDIYSQCHYGFSPRGYSQFSLITASPKKYF